MIKLMAKMTERNGFLSSCEPSFIAVTFIFLSFFSFFKFVLLRFCFVLFTEIPVYFFFNLIFENFDFTDFSYNCDNYSMIWDVPVYSMSRILSTSIQSSHRTNRTHICKLMLIISCLHTTRNSM